jgi:hypothetical protein
MTLIGRYFHAPASETQKTLIIAICVFMMSVMTIGLLWQAEIIANQREAIHWLETAKFGG